ncbi:MAG: peptide-methionine (S)-S-oxide reductase MsrA [Patescibacteria group bacterium]
METQMVVFGGGCFWCTEAVFKELKGVISVMSGYAGGETPNPTYESVCSGTTGHAEVSKIEFDPSVISFYDLLTVFFAVHDPTTLNRQGADVGTQYRSVVFYTTPEQQKETESYIDELNQSGPKVITQVAPLEKFFIAEEYHRNYFENHPEQAYCQAVINPKLEKLQEKFEDLLKR